MVLSRKSRRGASALLPPLPTASAGGKDTKGEGQGNQLTWRTTSGQVEISTGLAVQMLQKWCLIMLVLLNAHLHLELWTASPSFIATFSDVLCAPPHLLSMAAWATPLQSLSLLICLQNKAMPGYQLIQAENVFLLLAGESSRVTNDSETIQTLS